MSEDIKIPRSLCWLLGDMGSPFIKYLAWWLLWLAGECETMDRREHLLIGQRHLVSSQQRGTYWSESLRKISHLYNKI